MSFRPRLGQTAASALVALTLCTVGCHKKDPTTTGTETPSKVTVKGLVTDENNTPVASANVTIGALTVQTDAAGHYIAEPDYKLGDVAIFHVVAQGFGSRSQPVGVDSVGLSQNFQLRKHTVTQQVTLPVVAGGNVQVTYAPTDPNEGSITLTLMANQLVNAQGAAVSGNVDVAITYWGPNGNLSNTPAPMIGYNDRTIASGGEELLSYGMGDIDIRQGNELLKLATGQNLALSFTVPQAFADNVNELLPTDAVYPQLWSVDTNGAVWVSEGTVGNGRIAYDVATKTIHAQLPHLSAWNIDGRGTANGCVTGTFVDCNQKPVANLTAWLWLTGKGSLGHSTLQSGADGSFCGSIAGAGALTSKTSAVGTANWWVSLPKAPAATQCNPTDTSSFEELCLGQPASASVCRGSESPTRYAAGLARCKTPSTDFTMCGYCSNTTKPAGRCLVRTGEGQPYSGPAFVSGQCTNLGQVLVPTAACSQNTSTTDPCAGKGDMTGQRCSTDADCCPNSALECADGACVPRTADVN